MRRHYPFRGKRPLRVLLARQGIHPGESTLGRILAKGVQLGRIRPCAFCRGRVQLKKRRWTHPCTPLRSAAPPEEGNFARGFLQAVIQDLPFPSLQVDGGSGFRAEFEPAC